GGLSTSNSSPPLTASWSRTWPACASSPRAGPSRSWPNPAAAKTHLAVALAIKAVEAAYRGYFTTADDLVAILARARAEGAWAAKQRTYTAPTVLVVDDVGRL